MLSSARLLRHQRIFPDWPCPKSIDSLQMRAPFPELARNFATTEVPDARDYKHGDVPLWRVHISCTSFVWRDPIGAKEVIVLEALV